MAVVKILPLAAIGLSDKSGALERHVAQADFVQSVAGLVGPGLQFETTGDLFAQAASLPLNTGHFAGIVGAMMQLDAGWFTA